MKNLIENYEKACNELVAAFAEKQEFTFSGWVGDDIGGIATFNSEYYLNISEITLDMSSNQKKGFILDWENENLSNEKFINYKSYTMGLRHSML